MKNDFILVFVEPNKLDEASEDGGNAIIQTDLDIDSEDLDVLKSTSEVFTEILRSKRAEGESRGDYKEVEHDEGLVTVEFWVEKEDIGSSNDDDGNQVLGKDLGSTTTTSRGIFSLKQKFESPDQLKRIVQDYATQNGKPN